MRGSGIGVRQPQPQSPVWRVHSFDEFIAWRVRIRWVLVFPPRKGVLEVSSYRERSLNEFDLSCLWWYWLHVGSLVMGPGQKFLTRERLGQPSMVWVWVWKISPKNIKFFHFFTFRSRKSLRIGSESTQFKGRSASSLLRVKSKLGSGQVPYLVGTHHKSVHK